MNRPVDPGLQPERTALAWRRTALALVLGGALITRLLADVDVTLAVVLGGAAMAGGCGLVVLSVGRYRRVVAVWDAPLERGPGGAIVVVSSLVVLLLAVAATIVIIWGMLEA